MMQNVLLVLALIGLLLLTILFGAYMWGRLDDVQIGAHGFLALGLGVLLSLGLGIGLMSLVFFSSRRGYDDEQNRGWD